MDVTPGVPSDEAVGWAAHEAARRGVDLHVVLPDDPHRSLACHSAFAAVRTRARRIAPGVRVTAQVATESPARAAALASVDACLLVVGEATTETDELIRTAYCPVVVVPQRPERPERPSTVPAGTPHHPADTAPVVVGVGPDTGDEVLAFAFAEAASRHAGLLVVRAWTDPLIDLGALLPGRIARWDAADEHVRHALHEQLSRFVAAYPEVHVDTVVANDRCAALLHALAHRARLMVLGHPSHGTVLNGIAPSPALALAHHLPCPVIVVPPPDPVRRTWLPSRPISLADLRD
ncbi:universal stress protein [Pseudonocardia sp. GCM10023141]|uniref:universal stress protein n=1 Tax=Pseudonocardia sp. GCM10023141 TaxID=3252653 RepID=UPI003624167C